MGIDISDRNYKRLQGLAKPLSDTVDDVIGKVLDVAEPILKKEEAKMADNRKSIREVLTALEDKYHDYSFESRRIAGKQVLFKLVVSPEKGKQDTWFLWTPESRIYESKDDYAWVDFNQKQKDKADEKDKAGKDKYCQALGILRLGDGSLVYLDLKDLERYCTVGMRDSNKHEGDYWRMYIYHKEASPYLKISKPGKESEKYMSIYVDDDSIILKLLSAKH